MSFVAPRRYASVLAFLLAAAAATPAFAADKPKRVLYVTTAAGFSHDSRHLSKTVIEKIGKESGVFETVYDKNLDKKNTQDADAIKEITPQGLKGYDAVLFYTTGGKDQFPLSPENRQVLIDWVKAGGAFVGFHAATDTYADWAPYYEMIGGSFDGHPWHEDVKLDVEDPSHPSVHHLADSWTIKDEIYQFKNYDRKSLHVILSLSLEAEKGKAARTDKDVPIAWCKNHGKGRVFYTSLGHRDDVWTNPVYQTHVLGGIRWVLGLAHGDATPGQPKQLAWKKLFTKLEDCERSGESTWEIAADGTLKGTGKQGHIFTKEKYTDFQYRAEVNICEEGNSGMYFRCQNRATWPSGYEAQINNSHADPVRTGSLYNRVKIFDRLVPKSQPWFTQEVIAVGDHIVIKVNGKVVVDTVDRDFRAGTFAFQQHHVGNVIEIRNAQVRELPTAAPAAAEAK